MTPSPEKIFKVKLLEGCTPVVGCPMVSPKRFCQAFTVPGALPTSSAATSGWMSQASWVYMCKVFKSRSSHLIVLNLFAYIDIHNTYIYIYVYIYV